MTEDELAHHGVLGMKWGQRQSATGSQIKSARKRLKAKTTAYRAESKKLDSMASESAKRKSFEDKLKKNHQAYLKDPDRVIAARMTRGEKFAAILMSPGGPAGALPAATVIAATSAASRRIEYKQDTGAYNKTPTRVKKHVGLHKVRTAAVVGAFAAPAIIQTVGSTFSMAVAGKAAGNRAAAKAAPRGIGSVANKLKYIKPKGGVHKITTLK